MTFDASAPDVTFRSRPFGFDRAEVQAFVGNLLNDYGQVTRELERLQKDIAAQPSRTPEWTAEPESSAATPAAHAASATTAREVERILAGAERIAEEMRTRALEESSLITLGARDEADRKVREAEIKVGEMLKAAEARASEVLKEADARAADVVGTALQQATLLNRQAGTIRSQCLQMRDAIRSASDAAAAALKEIAVLEEERVPALQGRRA
jgi:cell division septum initiation protein DivIVA